MSADLLRLAASTLEVHVKAVSEEGYEGTWEDALNNWLGGPVGEFCALMSPVVVDAVAKLLQVISWMPSIADPVDMQAATVLARAILREGDDDATP